MKKTIVYNCPGKIIDCIIMSSLIAGSGIAIFIFNIASREFVLLLCYKDPLFFLMLLWLFLNKYLNL